MSSTSPERSLLVALTGGIASGKTAVANEFIALGVPVIDTDQIARDIVEPGTPALEKIVATFGPTILDSTGYLNRRRLREIIFTDAMQRKTLEAITHPAIREELARRSDAAAGVYKIHAIPLLVESGGAQYYDRVLVVDCPEELQIQRLVQRDHTEEVQALRILSAQATRQQRLAVADDVIDNSGDIATLKKQVHHLHESYLKLASANKTED